MYAMYRFQESPDQVWNRLTSYVERYIPREPAKIAEPKSEPAEEVEETPEPSAAPAPARPDPLPWLVEHKEYWPDEIILREAVEFPAVSSGKVVGSLQVPAGTMVKVIEIGGDEIAVDHMGGRRKVPVAITDLAEQAEKALAKAEAEVGPQDAAIASIPPPDGEKGIAKDEKFREATREQISKGMGASFTRQATTFRLFAPTAKAVSVVLYDEPSGNKGRTVRPLRQQSNGLWDGTVRGDLTGKYYTYLLDPTEPKRAKEVIDPYAVNAAANSTRGRITPMTAPVARGPRLESPTDAIIYEMHVRDFTIAPNSGVENSGLYPGWTEEGTRLATNEEIQTGLDHLTELGITHVQIMPAHDFENDEASRNYNWGYMTSSFFSPEGMFATNPDDDSRVHELKALIGAMHARGIGVIMDVVYNHTAGKSSLSAIAPEYYYRRNSDGSLANGSGCGNEVRSEAPMARRLILDSVKFWVREYGVDGFRFDLMALMDQETIRQAERELRAIHPTILLYGEPWSAGATPLRDKADKGAIRQMPVGAFNDDFRNALKGKPDGNEPGWIQNGSSQGALKTAMLGSDWFASPAQSLNYMTCHDNLVLWDKLEKSMPNSDPALRKETMKFGYLALFTSQGVPFIHGGEEFARTKFGDHNSYEAADSVNQVDWALKEEHWDLFTYVREIIALRKAHPMFRLRTRAQVQSRVQFRETGDEGTLMFTVTGEGVPGETWKRACVVLNSSDETDAVFNLPPGDWSIAFDATGAAAVGPVSGKLTVRHKSGAILYQQ